MRYQRGRLASIFVRPSLGIRGSGSVADVVKWVLLFAGGGLGAALRFALALRIEEHARSVFPWGTLWVNALGCLLIGLLATWADDHHLLPASGRLFLVPGLLGGFTTFSTFGLETVLLIEDGMYVFALTNVLASLAVCGIAVIAGIAAARALA